MREQNIPQRRRSGWADYPENFFNTAQFQNATVPAVAPQIGLADRRPAQSTCAHLRQGAGENGRSPGILPNLHLPRALVAPIKCRPGLLPTAFLHHRAERKSTAVRKQILPSVVAASRYSAARNAPHTTVTGAATASYPAASALSQASSSVMASGERPKARPVGDSGEQRSLQVDATQAPTPSPKKAPDPT